MEKQGCSYHLENHNSKLTYTMTYTMLKIILKTRQLLECVQ